MHAPPAHHVALHSMQCMLQARSSAPPGQLLERGGREEQGCAQALSAGRLGLRAGEWKAAPRVCSSRTKTPSASSWPSRGRSSSTGPVGAKRAPCQRGRGNDGDSEEPCMHASPLMG